MVIFPKCFYQRVHRCLLDKFHIVNLAQSLSLFNSFCLASFVTSSTELSLSLFGVPGMSSFLTLHFKHSLGSPSMSPSSNAAVRVCCSLFSVAARESHGLRRDPLHFVPLSLAPREVCSQSLNLGPESSLVAFFSSVSLFCDIDQLAAPIR